MGDIILGTWREESIDDPVSIALEMGFSREMIDGYNKVRDQMRVTTKKEGNVYKSVVEVPGMPSIEESFELGVETENTDPTGTVSKVVFELKGDTFVETRNSDKYKVVTTRKYSADGKKVVATAQCGSAKANAIWVKCD